MLKYILELFQIEIFSEENDFSFALLIPLSYKQHRPVLNKSIKKNEARVIAVENLNVNSQNVIYNKSITYKNIIKKRSIIKYNQKTHFSHTSSHSSQSPTGLSSEPLGEDHNTLQTLCCI